MSGMLKQLILIEMTHAERRAEELCCHRKHMEPTTLLHTILWEETSVMILERRQGTVHQLGVGLELDHACKTMPFICPI